MADPSGVGLRVGDDKQFCDDRMPAAFRGGNHLDSRPGILQRAVLPADAWVWIVGFVALPAVAVDWSFVGSY